MDSELGRYLAARRAAVTPAMVGLPGGARRRVPGLRREEVAMLAGVSVDYLTRLEQGRERSPSPQVVDALAAALRLDDDARVHLHGLAGTAPRPRQPTPRRVDPALLQLMASWHRQPAIVLDRAYDVIAANALAEALFGLERTRNLVELVFLDSAGADLYADWPTTARGTVAGLRRNLGLAPDDQRLREVLETVLARSETFRDLWATYDVEGKSLTRKTLVHPQVGRIDLVMQTFEVRSAPGQELCVYDAESGSESAANLALLGSIAATARVET